MIHIKTYTYSCLVLLLILVSHRTKAQADNFFYTGDNKIIVSLEGKDGRYQFVSEELLVRYNKSTQKIECILNLHTLYPSNKGIPPAMAFEVLFGSKYPDLVFEIDAPVEKINSRNLYPETLDKKISVNLQGITNQTTIPIVFTPNNNTLLFSTNIDLMLDNFQASIPVKYLPLLTGRVQFAINNAQWVDQDLQ